MISYLRDKVNQTFEKKEMGNSHANHTVRIETRDGKIFQMSYYALVEHILLLRKVIDDPEMTKEGLTLSFFILDYCKRMGQNEMRTKDQQSKLPWQIEWIWHVHRLHPLHYFNDCQKQLSGGLVTKQEQRIPINYVKKNQSKTRFSSDISHQLFHPSIDLTKAVVAQNEFLDKFRNHFLYSYDLTQSHRSNFHNFVQDYVLFMKSTRQNRLIIPTFDIDLIWHTHMRYPLDYHQFSTSICGFILDHDDSIHSSDVLVERL